MTIHILHAPALADSRQSSDTVATSDSSRRTFPASIWEAVLEALDGRVERVATGCWIYTGPVCKQGYGRVRVSGVRSPVLVHRIAYAVAVAPPPKELKVCHSCDVPMCVNPDHLWLGTQRDNLRDMFAKGRARPGGCTEPVGFDPDSWRRRQGGAA